MLAYNAPAECPDVSAFEAKVAAYGSEVMSAAVIVTRTTREAGAGYHGRIVVGSAPSREVDATTCEEVADALALITALLLRDEPSSREKTPEAPKPTANVTERTRTTPSLATEARSITVALGAAIDVRRRRKFVR